MIRLVHVMLHTKMNRKTTSPKRKNLTTSDPVSDLIRPCIYTGSDQVGWDRIGSGPMVGSDPVGSEDAIFSNKKKTRTNKHEGFINH